MKKRYVVAGILAAAGLICGGIAYYQYYQDAHAGQEYEKIKEKVVTEEPKKPEETPKSTVEIPIDFQTLQNMNPDIYAWIKVPGTVIDYPIVQSGTDNSYYLNHNFYGEKNAHGTIFLDESCSTEDPVLLLHGHHMKDGTMFGSLKQYRDKEFRQAHTEILLDMGEGFDTYEVFAILQIDLTKEDYFAYEKIPKDADSLTAYLKQMQKNATWYEQPEQEDKLLLLSTCAYGSEDERMVVAAYKQ